MYPEYAYHHPYQIIPNYYSISFFNLFFTIFHSPPSSTCEIFPSSHSFLFPDLFPSSRRPRWFFPQSPSLSFLFPFSSSLSLFFFYCSTYSFVLAYIFLASDVTARCFPFPEASTHLPFTPCASFSSVPAFQHSSPTFQAVSFGIPRGLRSADTHARLPLAAVFHRLLLLTMSYSSWLVLILRFPSRNFSSAPRHVS